MQFGNRFHQSSKVLWAACDFVYKIVPRRKKWLIDRWQMLMTIIMLTKNLMWHDESCLCWQKRSFHKAFFSNSKFFMITAIENHRNRQLIKDLIPPAHHDSSIEFIMRKSFSDCVRFFRVRYRYNDARVLQCKTHVAWVMIYPICFILHTNLAFNVE